MESVRDNQRTNSRFGGKTNDKPAWMENGKLPPQAIDLEEAVLGALMLEKNAITMVIEILKPEMFYKDAHQEIYGAILELFNTSQPIDILTVTQELSKKTVLEVVGGPHYISELTSRIASSANIEFHARIIVQKHIQRELIRSSSNIVKQAYDDSADVFGLLDLAEKELFNISEGTIKKDYEKMSSLLQQAIEQIEKAKNNTDGISGVPTGFNDLDKLTAGWQRSDLIIIAARPGMGKTAFVLSMARNIAVDYHLPVAVFSLEMSAVQLVNRLIASESGISAEKLRKGTLNESEYEILHNRLDKLADAPLYIDDTASLSIFELRAKARRLAHQNNIKIIIIDYLQLMTAGGNGGNRVQEISEISRSLKVIAKELEIPLIALSQLSRSVETRGGDKKPLLSDLRESGSIEQDADIVSFIYRPEYYGITQDEDGNTTMQMGEFIVAKHRNGSTETVKLKFIGELAKFTNFENTQFMSDGNSFEMPANATFDSESNTMTRGSRMNDPDDDFLGGLDPSEEPSPF